MRHFLAGIGTPIIALLCAILLWFFVVIDKSYETTVNIPIKLTNVPENLTPSNPFPKTAKVLVSGSGRQLIMLFFSHPELLINCEEARRGAMNFRLSGRNVELGGGTGANVLLVKDPSQISIDFDAIIRKTLPVEADLKITLAENRTMAGKPILIPNAITISGPRCHVALIEKIHTRRVELRDLQGDTVFFAFIKRPDYYGIVPFPNKIRVKIEIEPIIKRPIKDIPIRLIGIPDGVQAALSVQTVSLVIAGAEKDVNMVKKAFINVFVKYSCFSMEQQEEVEPTVSIISNVEWSNLVPPKVRLLKK